MPKQKKSKPLNVMITEEDYANFQALAAILRCSMAQLVRTWLGAATAMEIDDTPTCADGSGCRCTTLHPRKPPKT